MNNMGKVNVLSPEIISKIAAGEVIERPASVVKELIENAIDAKTQTIELELQQAGKTLIRIKDSGEGIDNDDIEKIFLRHATSKIKNIDDLFSINSLGFRGEALYSIAAVSDITLRSKTKSQETGWEIHIRGGEKVNLRPCSMLQGTDIEIKQLFFNTPARKKFLKADTTELQQIIAVFTPYTLLYPGCRFSFVHNKKVILDMAPTKSITGRIATALNLKETHLLETGHTLAKDGISIRVILGDINIQRPRKNLQFIFINNRPVNSRNISFHLNQVYKLLMPEEIYPFFSIYINMPSQDIDANVHPTKREVKIRNEYKVVSVLRSLCEHTLTSCGKPKQIQDFEFLASAHTYQLDSDFKTQSVKEEEQQYLLTNNYPTCLYKEKMTGSAEEPLKNRLSQSRYIGSFIKKYLFFESETSLLIMDQHAAQERVTYEKLINQINKDSIEIQHLLSPIVIKLSAQEMLAWEVLKEKIEKIGFPTTLWDNETIALHSHPLLINNPEIALRNLLSSEERKCFDKTALARRACHNSLKAGYEINNEQAQYLRDELIKCQSPFACPHGRPTIIEIPENILIRNFLR